MKCPHCHQEIPAKPIYDPSDPVQQRGYDDTVFNRAQQGPPYRQNPYPDGSDEYYRWNRGLHAAYRI